MTSTLASLRWLDVLLTGSSTLQGLLATPPTGLSRNIHADKAPPSSNMPYVVVSQITPAKPMLRGDGYISMYEHIFQVVSWSDTTKNQDTEDIADAIQLALHNATAERDGYKLNCLLHEVIRNQWVEDGKPLVQSGGRYRIIARPL